MACRQSRPLPDLSKADIAVLGHDDSYYWPGYFEQGSADVLYARLQRELAPRYVSREGAQARDVASMGDVLEDGSYPLYGEHPPLYPWTPTTKTIRNWLAENEGEVSNHLIVRRLETGEDLLECQQNQTQDLTDQSVVMMVFFGEERLVKLQHVTTGAKQTVLVEHGSLLVLGERTTAEWKLSIVRKAFACNEMICLTFRSIQTMYQPTTGDIY